MEPEIAGKGGIRRVKGKIIQKGECYRGPEKKKRAKTRAGQTGGGRKLSKRKRSGESFHRVTRSVAKRREMAIADDAASIKVFRGRAPDISRSG